MLAPLSLLYVFVLIFMAHKGGALKSSSTTSSSSSSSSSSSEPAEEIPFLMQDGSVERSNLIRDATLCQLFLFREAWTAPKSWSQQLVSKGTAYVYHVSSWAKNKCTTHYLRCSAVGVCKMTVHVQWVCPDNMSMEDLRAAADKEDPVLVKEGFITRYQLPSHTCEPNEAEKILRETREEMKERFRTTNITPDTAVSFQ